ncbi:MAG: acetyl-CoA carboxylase biotin carboxyl carrier protein [Cellulosilyticaceae bacterium]
MSIDTIKTLIQEFNNSDITRLKLNYEDFQIELEKEKEVVCTTPIQQMMPTQIAPVAMAEVNIVTGDGKPAGTQVKSPMVGTFYASSSPDSEPFVKVGQRVKKGDVICIIEAMKLMNEVEAEVDGEIIAILAENEQMVEFDQPLFVIK